MTDDDIKRIASRHSAYADCVLTIRHEDVIAFARELERLVRGQVEHMERLRQATAEVAEWRD